MNTPVRTKSHAGRSRTSIPVRASEPVAWHTLHVGDSLARLEVRPEKGLTGAGAKERLERYGPNELPSGVETPLWKKVLAQFRDVVVLVLLGATAVSAALGEWTDAAVILAIVLLNTILSFFQERRAERALDALKKLAAPMAHVLRDGRPEEIPSREIVPGDLLLLEAGQFVPADARIVESMNFAVEEAALTGESVPVEKDAGAVFEADVAMGERANLVYSGTVVSRGRGSAVVTATGGGTELGRIANLLGGVEKEETPLQKRLDQVGKILAVLTLVICGIVFAVGRLRGEPALEMFLTAVSLAVAAIPEGLPAVVTIVLALGMQNMVKRHVIIRRLRAVETLGSTTVICSDKTGTLTQNAMVVRCFWMASGAGGVTGEGYEPRGEFRLDSGEAPSGEVRGDLLAMLRIAALCNDARLISEEGRTRLSGDPTEGALVAAAAKFGLERAALERETPRVQEAAFDSVRKRMSTIHRGPAGGTEALVKGAPDLLLARCAKIRIGGREEPLTDEWRRRILDANREFARDALRVLAMAYRPGVDAAGPPDAETLERDLVFAGLLAMSDPPRPEVADSIRICRRAGIRPVMITGDYADTALAVGRDLGLVEEDTEVVTGRELVAMSDETLRERVQSVAIYARVAPEDKLRIVEALQEGGQIVAMTGDGVNDAPALKRAAIGVAMGRSGTDVAREASDMILTDDNFSSIVAAVEEGRGIFDNIRKFVFYLLSCNISEVLTLFISILVGLPRPLVPVQILWINLVTDGAPALALGVEPKERGIMHRPPRPPSEGVLNRATLAEIALYGAFITAAALAAFIIALRIYGSEDLAHARTAAFGTMAFSQLVHSLNCRSPRESVFRLGVLKNLYLLAAIAVSAGMTFFAIYTPFGNSVFQTAPIAGADLVVCGALSISPLLFGEIYKAIRRGMERRRR